MYVCMYGAIPSKATFSLKEKKSRAMKKMSHLLIYKYVYMKICTCLYINMCTKCKNISLIDKS